ncbi:sugar phosphate nucleotidyltransferase [uncultured Paludibaculum sp.]|uniref:sugar phosphate nucleotidyltransferase n=1 Tax=uncultured Paludibaculum sp. TaxID=1765020 RepID=UPI002AABD4D0|nr:sugar phosphate nucleotidyltransferase [uncultured Paludibaculum sp.]
MRIRKAVITAASPSQRRLPLQNLIDRDGQERSVLGILLEEVVRARVEEICVVVCPGDAEHYALVTGDHAGRVRFVEQHEPRGYGHAIHCAREFTAGEPFLHLVSDHLYVNHTKASCATELIEVAELEDCSVSSVQATREGQLKQFGAVGGQRVAGRERLYKVDTVLEKPTPTEAEQRIVVPGLRSGHYLCFFGMHVLAPAVMTILEELLADPRTTTVSLSMALAELARRERFLALRMTQRRYDLGVRYGLLTAQLALGLSGRDRDEILSQMVELMALREMAAK